MDRQTWLEARRQGIGSSDAAAVCGLSPWATPLAVWLDKKGLLPPQRGEQLDWGHRMEPLLAAAWGERFPAYKAHTGGLTRHPEHPWLLATPDRLAYLPDRPERVRLVELKTARSAEGWGEEGTDHVPPAYLLQVQHQLCVLGPTAQDEADIAVLIGGNEFRVYTVRRSDELLDRLFPILEDFWELVETNRPPQPDWSHPDTPRLVNLLHESRPGTSLDLGEGEGELVRQYQDLGEELKALGLQREVLKARLVERLGEAEEGRLPDGRRLRRRKTTVAAHAVEEYSYWDFRILGGGRSRG